MPPKPSKKAEQKQKEKVIDDKTFGLKNKKGAKQQKFIKMVQHQVKNPNQSLSKLEAEKHAGKKQDEDRLDDITKLLKPVAGAVKVDKDVDPKSILCMFFKQGMCQKGDKCKFSHDLEIERKSEKKNIFVDKRDDKGEDNMDDWDENTLLDVVDKKHGEKDKNKPKTAIICKYFLQAIEESKYGWFWECPNGDTCIYRHAVPPGYVCKKDRVKIDQVNKEDEITLEDLIEKERAALGANLTKINFETFCSWKKRKLVEKQKEKAKEEKRKRTDLKAGKEAGLSGRDLFTFNPDLVTQDDEEADETKYAATVILEEGQAEEEMEAKVIDESMFLNGYDLPGSSKLDIDEDLFDDDIDLPSENDEDERDKENCDNLSKNRRNNAEDDEETSLARNLNKMKTGAEDS
uniref:C3H1-type domain-containing protein n=1 Tax=Romanomermis culicivorax TaxID=13658 RepID=A0A915IEA1_ROMCU